MLTGGERIASTGAARDGLRAAEAVGPRRRARRRPLPAHVADSDAIAAAFGARQARRHHRRRLDRLRGRGIGAAAGRSTSRSSSRRRAARAGARPGAGGIYRDLHRDRGVELHAGVAVARIEGAGTRRARRDGRRAHRRLPTPSSRARCDPAHRARAERRDRGRERRARRRGACRPRPGSVRSRRHRQRRAPVLRPPHPRRALGERLDQAGGRRGRCSASRTAYGRVPYFFSDQYDVGMEYAGGVGARTELVLRGDSRAASSSRSGGARAASSPA